MSRFPILMITALMASWWPVVVPAQTCRIALTLALDVSSSVDQAEYRLQIEGIAQALQDPAVRAAIYQVPGTTVALQVFEWSGEKEQAVIQDWAVMHSAVEIDAMIAVLRAHRRSFAAGSTAMGEALAFARRQLLRGPECAAGKIDVSGDGQSNVGIYPQDLYWEADFRGVTVNGLAIESSAAELSDYFRRFVIHGPDAFVVKIGTYNDYARAIRDKLIRELGLAQLAMSDPISGPSFD